MSKTPTDIRSLARTHTKTAIKTLVGIMNQAKASPAARVAAANAILDRGWGKPAPTVERVEYELSCLDFLIEIAAMQSEDDEELEAED